MTDDDLLEELLALERAGWQSLCDGTGAKFYGGIMSDDALMVLANGAIMDRAAVSSALSQAPPWARYEITDARLVSVGNNAAALVYIGTGYREGADEPFVGAMSAVYRRDDPGWALVLYQQTSVAD
ncbi:MAG: nuclear transport factor 2 family protein [Mycobacterium sp.]